MGTCLGPKYIPYTYMDPLGSICIRQAMLARLLQAQLSQEKLETPNALTTITIILITITMITMIITITITSTITMS